MTVLPEQTSRLDPKTIYPRLWAASLVLLEACEARGARYYMISGYRSIPEQNLLYAQGRTTPGNIVTKARGGQSYHNQGLAIDFCFDKDRSRPGLQPDFAADKYLVLAEEARKVPGLEPGFFWAFKDCPHVQWVLPAGVALFRPQQQTKPAKYLSDVNPDGKNLQGVFTLLGT